MVYCRKSGDKDGDRYGQKQICIRILPHGTVVPHRRMCRDSGDSAAATKLEFAGKVIITAVSLPVIKGFVSYVAGLVNGV